MKPLRPILINLILITLLVTLSSACTALSGPQLPTPLPTEYVPTAIALTVAAQGITVLPPDPSVTQPQDTPEPQASPTPAPTGSPPDATEAPPGEAGGSTEVPPTETPTLAVTPPGELPFARIQINSPGPSSVVISPFLMRAYLLPGPSGVVRVELLGEDGRLLMREVRNYQYERGARITMGLEVAFEIPGAAELARLQISVEDEFNRVMGVSSVDLLLLSAGQADLNPAGDLQEAIVIEEPSPNVLVQGGTLRVSGWARPRTEKPLMIELQTNEGTIVGSRQVAVQGANDGHHGIFAIDVPYSVSEPTRVRLVVWERGERIPGVAELTSMEVMLSP